MKNIPNIQYVTPNALKNYLEHEGWHTDYALKNGLGVQYISPDSKMGVILPTKMDISDYYTSVLNVIDSLATYYNCPASSLIVKLSSPLSDILKWRIHNIQTRNGTLPLEQASELIEAIKTFISTSILDVKTPEKRHKRVTNNVINNYCLGQSERGSYVLNILCPLSSMELELFEAPIARQANEHLLKNLFSIQHDLSKNNSGKVEENIYNGVYSSNFVDAIAGISEAINEISDIELAVNWCEELPIDQNLNIPIKTIIEAKYTDEIRKIADKFEKEEIEEQVFVGKVCELKAAPDIGRRENGFVKITSLDEDQKICKINIKLGKEDLQKATEAFESGLNIITSGKLIKGGRDKTLEAISFDILR